MNGPGDTQFHTFPKGDKHAHLLFSGSWAALRALPGGSGLAQSPPSSYRGLRDFLSYISATVLPLFASFESRESLINSAFEEFVRDGVTLVESSVDIHSATAAGINWQELTEAIFRIAGRSRLDFSLELGIPRDCSAKILSSELEAALSTNRFSGVDIYGDEYVPVSKLWSEIGPTLLATNLYRKLHCGEVSSAASMRAEMEMVRPHAIQHGIAAADDASLAQELVRSGISLNVAPESNIRLGAVQDYKTHPLRRLFDQGVLVTIASDDRLFFEAGVSDQMQSLVSSLVFSVAEISHIRLASLTPTGSQIGSQDR